MPPKDNRRVVIKAVKIGETISLPARNGGGYVKERAPAEGVFFEPPGAEHGFFVEATRLWEELDKLIG